MRIVKAAPVLERVKDDIDRVFDRFFPAPFLAEPGFRTYEGTTPVWMPAFDLVETEKDYVIRLDAPGALEGLERKFGKQRTSHERIEQPVDLLADRAEDRSALRDFHIVPLQRCSDNMPRRV